MRTDDDVTIGSYDAATDAAATFAVFQAAVRRTAAKDYAPEQIEAWLGRPRHDLTAWGEARARAHTFVARTGAGEVVGFSDLLPDGLVDMLFVHPDAGGRGVARALLTAVAAEARARGLRELRTFASRTAQPVFARLGFTVWEDRPHNTARGVVVPNAEMRCTLGPA